MSKFEKKILVAPLDWGLGHITRTFPIIKLLIERGHRVETCGNAIAEKLYQEEFPGIPHQQIQGYNPMYSRTNKQGWAMIKQSPKFFSIIKKEQQIAEELVRKNRYNAIISDNRFGFRSNNTTNIFICHQTEIMGPLILKPIFRFINRGYINRFDFCWIPDTSEKINLSGELSSYENNNCFRIGPQSRFNTALKTKQSYTYKYTAILSGPEPQRSLFEEKVSAFFNKQDFRCAIIQGAPLAKKNSQKKIDFFPHLNSKDFLTLINESEIIICRSGYSNIMDLSRLQKKAILIPTPGQTEQEYLAKYHEKTSNIFTLKQDDISEMNMLNTTGKIIAVKTNTKSLESALIRADL